jgi:hypothetical protein
MICNMYDCMFQCKTDEIRTFSALLSLQVCVFSKRGFSDLSFLESLSRDVPVFTPRIGGEVSSPERRMPDVTSLALGIHDWQCCILFYVYVKLANSWIPNIKESCPMCPSTIPWKCRACGGKAPCINSTSREWVVNLTLCPFYPVWRKVCQIWEDYLHWWNLISVYGAKSVFCWYLTVTEPSCSWTSYGFPSFIIIF